MSTRWPDTPLRFDTPLARAAKDAGGVLLAVNLAMPEGQNGGCGAPVNVIGTNGGTMTCGSMLTMAGKTEPYYCGLCSK